MTYCAVLTSVDSNDILYIVRKYCTLLTSVDSKDMLYRYTVQYITVVHIMYITQILYNSLLTYYVNTVT